MSEEALWFTIGFVFLLGIGLGYGWGRDASYTIELIPTIGEENDMP